MNENSSDISVSAAHGWAADSSSCITEEIKITGVQRNPFGCPAETRRRRSRLSCHSRSYDKENHGKKSSLLKIFSWFQGKVKRSDSLGTCSRTTEGSVSTLSGSIPDNIFVPLSKSRSADNQSLLDQSVDASQQRNSNASRFIPRSSSFTENNPRTNAFSDPSGSVKSEDAISCDQKKRAAPLPPVSEVRREDVPSGRPSVEVKDSLQNSTERSSSRNSDTRKDAVRVKRKAPDPPSNAGFHRGSPRSQELPQRSASASTEMFNSNLNADDKMQSIPSTLRSAASQSSVRCSISSNSSIQSIHGKELGNFSDSPTSTKSGVDSCSKFLKPWYKRRTKSKVAKVSQKQDVMDQVYEFWRPELQFNDGKISVSPNSQSPCGTVQSEKSVLQKVVDSCKTKRKSQVSMLANISQLNLEAEIALKREKALNNKTECFDDPTSPKTLFLTQQDVTQSNRQSTGKLGSASSLHESNISSNERGSRIQEQGNTSHFQEFSSHTKLVQVNKKTTTLEVTSNSFQAFESNHSNKQKGPSSKDSNSSNKNVPLDSSSRNPSLIQMANLDAEQFYKLAKDIKTPLGKSPSPLAQKARPRGGVEPVSRPSAGDPPKSNRNFGIRMNQLFAPDVSVILEASESVTSSGTVPHDDCFSDQNSVVTRNFDCIYEDLSIRNDSLFDSRLVSANAREIMEELADVRQEIERINEEENEAEHNKFRNGERRRSSEQTNRSSPNAKARSPPPLDGTPRPEAKLRWECSACTLINVPWRITCEACTSRRPTNPTRIADDGTRLPSSKSDSEDQSCEPTFTEMDDRMKERISAEAAVRTAYAESDRPISELMKAEKQAQWELELRKYFGAKDFSKGLQEQAQESIVIFNKVNKKSEQNRASVDVNDKATDSEPNLSEVRRARLEKFKLQENDLQGDGQSAAAQRLASSRNEGIRQDSGGEGSENNLDAFLFQCNKERNFYKNDAPKRLIISPAGAVKNTIHIFDQRPDTENQNEKNLKVKQTRRKSVGLVKTQASLFEKNDLNCDSETASSKGFSKNIQDSKQPIKNPEVDISSAISKFDEIAAMAEIERLKPMLLKPNPTKPRKKIIIHTKEDSNQFISLNHMQRNHGHQTVSPIGGGKADSDSSIKNNPQEHNVADSESNEQQCSQSEMSQEMNNEFGPVIVMGGAEADTSQSRDSASFLSNSFDLMEASEFQQIEAEHSQRGSPITSFYEDAYQADYDSDSTELFMDASSADINEKGLQDFSNRTEATTSDEPDLRPQPEPLEAEGQRRLAVEELSRQLTLKRGIADFKATMSAESSGWSATSTMRISHLLKKLEAAIGRGDHSDAADLARELATLKVECSVSSGVRKEEHTNTNVSHGHSNLKTGSQNAPFETQKQQHNPTAMLSTEGRGGVSSVQGNQEGQMQGYLDDSRIRNPRMDVVLYNNNDVTIRENKSSSDRRKVKSDTVSKLIDTSTDTSASKGAFRVQLFVEDRSSHQGPLSITVTASMTVGELRSAVFEKFGFPAAIQRWILGRRLAEDDNATLAQHKVTREGCPLFLYLVAPPTATAPAADTVHINASKTPEMARAVDPKPTSGQKKVVGVSEQPNVLISPLAAAKSPLKLGRYTPSAPAEDPVIGNELIRREMNELERQSPLNNTSRSKNTPRTKESNAGQSARVSVDTAESRRDAPPQKRVQKDAAKTEKKLALQSKTSVITVNQRSSELSSEKRPETSDIKPVKLAKLQDQRGSAPSLPPTSQTSISYSSNAQTSNTKVSNPYSFKAQFANSQAFNVKHSNSQISNTQSSNTRQNNAQISSAKSMNGLGINSHTSDTEHASSSPSSSNHTSSSQTSSVQAQSSKASYPATAPGPASGWVCPRCTFVNNARRPGCEVCGAEKPDDGLDKSFRDANADEFKQLDRAVSELEKDALVKCNEAFECRVCFSEVPPRAGVVLRECLHVFCRDCLANAVRYSDTAAVKCLYRDDSYACDASIQDREIRALVTAAEYEAHLNKSVKQAAVSMQNVFHCKTPDCRGFCVFEDNVNTFLCNVCYRQNCLTCQAQHTGLSCKKYQEMVTQKEDIDSLKTQKFFEDMVKRGDGMPCPHCEVMLMRKWGCDWMRCPMCRTEICWVTRGPRWGPQGTGDTSGGCQCGVNGRKCHPKCTYCH